MVLRVCKPREEATGGLRKTHLEPRMPHGSVDFRIVLDGSSRASGADCKLD